MVTGDPDMPPARRNGAVFPDADGRSKLHDYLRVSGTDTKGKTKQQGKKKFPHISSRGHGQQAKGHFRLARRQNERWRSGQNMTTEGLCERREDLRERHLQIGLRRAQDAVRG